MFNPKQIEQDRANKDTFFKSHPQSPLSASQKAHFNGLDYYAPNAELDLRLTADEYPSPKPTIEVQTSTGDVRTYQKWGRVHFTVSGEAAELTIFYSPENGYFFLPFQDKTNGAETYGAGRYLDPEWLGDADFHIDFNKAYSPYCAYNDNWSCPLTPPENHLPVRIEAGEKNPDEAWAGQH